MNYTCGFSQNGYSCGYVSENRSTPVNHGGQSYSSSGYYSSQTEHQKQNYASNNDRSQIAKVKVDGAKLHVTYGKNGQTYFFGTGIGEPGRISKNDILGRLQEKSKSNYSESVYFQYGPGMVQITKENNIFIKQIAETSKKLLTNEIHNALSEAIETHTNNQCSIKSKVGKRNMSGQYEGGFYSSIGSQQKEKFALGKFGTVSISSTGPSVYGEGSIKATLALNENIKLDLHGRIGVFIMQQSIAIKTKPICLVNVCVTGSNVYTHGAGYGVNAGIHLEPAKKIKFSIGVGNQSNTSKIEWNVKDMTAKQKAQLKIVEEVCKMAYLDESK